MMRPFDVTVEASIIAAEPKSRFFAVAVILLALVIAALVRARRAPVAVSVLIAPTLALPLCMRLALEVSVDALVMAAEPKWTVPSKPTIVPSAVRLDALLIAAELRAISFEVDVTDDAPCIEALVSNTFFAVALNALALPTEAEPRCVRLAADVNAELLVIEATARLMSRAVDATVVLDVTAADANSFLIPVALSVDAD